MTNNAVNAVTFILTVYIVYLIARMVDLIFLPIKKNYYREVTIAIPTFAIKTKNCK